MKSRLTLGLWPRLIFIGIAIAVLGIAPRPHAYRQSLERARLALAAGQGGDAAQAITDAAHLAPWRADLWEQAGIYALRAGDYDQAMERLNEARRVGGDQGLSLQGWLALGDARREIDNTPEKAIEAWTAAFERYGSSQELLVRLEKAHLEIGDSPAAAADLRAQIEVSPDEADLYYRLGMYLSVQQPEDALEPLDRAAELDIRYQNAANAIRRAILSARYADSPAYTLLAIGRAQAGLGEWNLAHESFRRAVHDRPDYAEAWAYLGEALQHTDEGSVRLRQSSTSDGLQELQTALELDPSSLAARTFLAIYWTRQGDSGQALQTIQEAAALDPNNPALQVQFASLMAETGDLSGAQQAFEHAIDLSPYDPTYRRSLVEFAIQYDYQVEALALPIARQLASDYPDDPAALDLMGRVLLEQNDLAGAERFFQRALENAPQFAAAHMHLGLVYALRGDRERARQEFAMAIDLAAGGPVGVQAQRLLETYFP